MPCFTVSLEAQPQARMRAALARLDAALAQGSVQVVIGAQGGIAFKGWQDRETWSDLCAYRRLLASNSAALRRALARAEAISGRRVNERAIAAGVHSHDGGTTWGSEP